MFRPTCPDGCAHGSFRAPATWAACEIQASGRTRTCSTGTLRRRSAPQRGGPRGGQVDQHVPGGPYAHARGPGLEVDDACGPALAHRDGRRGERHLGAAARTLRRARDQDAAGSGEGGRAVRRGHQDPGDEVDAGQCGRERVDRVGQHVQRTAVLDHQPVVQDDHPIGQGDRVEHVVRDQDGGRAGAPYLLAEQLAQLGCGAHVQLRERLVEQQHRRLRGQRPGERDPLPLPAGQRTGSAVRQVPEPHGRQPPVRRTPSPGRTHPGRPRPERHVLPRAQVREHQRVLAEQPDRPALGPDRRLRPPVAHGGQGPLPHAHHAVGRHEVAGEDRQQGRLARPVGPEDRHQLPRVRRERDVERERAATHDHLGVQRGHAARPGRHARAASSTATAAATRSSDRATAVPWVTPAPLNAA